MHHTAIKTLELGTVPPEETNEIAAFLAEAMCQNPLHLAIFGSKSRSGVLKQKKLFLRALKEPHLQVIAAKSEGEIAAVMCYTHSGHCQLVPLSVVLMLPALRRDLGSTLGRVLRWRWNWKKHDCKQEHIHFGPLAVAEHLRGNGIGSAMLNYFCKLMDQQKQTAYLETDKWENVTLYERFLFRTVETDEIFGVENWFMIREPQ